MTGQRQHRATASDLDGDQGGHALPDRYEAYREHLNNCPRRHLGLLADCPEGARLRHARTGEEGGYEPTLQREVSTRA
ncbi:hypothetical protein [Streptomyces sp. NRRL B-1347]|uniref:hypothetical protein n=1 Tax=Streptomyces sp. NRRL B-1347 TaxID=1476877 RepID=UPI0004CB5D1E|nr:hypothetical protein [Streptomyces sp. NRRL B-1347]